MHFGMVGLFLANAHQLPPRGLVRRAGSGLFRPFGTAAKYMGHCIVLQSLSRGDRQSLLVQIWKAGETRSWF
jgi:hypothetical protein